MKVHLITYSLLFLSCSIYGQRYEAKDFYLKGPIKNLIELEFESEEDHLDNNYDTVDTMIFRDNGFLKYNKRYRNNGELLVEEKVELNSNEKLEKYTKYHIGLKFKEERFEYDTTENFSLKSTYEDGKLQRTFKTIIGSNNEISKVEIYNSENQLVSTNDIEKKIAYDKLHSNSKAYELTHYENYYEKVEKNKQGIIKAYWKLDNNDNILIRTFYNDDGSIRNTSIYELDKYGNWTKETFEAENHFAISIRTIEYYIDE